MPTRLALPSPMPWKKNDEKIQRFYIKLELQGQSQTSKAPFPRLRGSYRRGSRKNMSTYWVCKTTDKIFSNQL